MANRMSHPDVLVTINTLNHIFPDLLMPKASAAVLPTDSFPRSIKGEANVLYTAPSSVVETQELHWTTLPLKEDQAIEWHIFRPPGNSSANIAAQALSIEENDLVAFATW
jgi:hypothetical protein